MSRKKHSNLQLYLIMPEIFLLRSFILRTSHYRSPGVPQYCASGSLPERANVEVQTRPILSLFLGFRVEDKRSSWKRLHIKQMAPGSNPVAPTIVNEGFGGDTIPYYFYSRQISPTNLPPVSIERDWLIQSFCCNVSLYENPAEYFTGVGGEIHCYSIQGMPSRA